MLRTLHVPLLAAVFFALACPPAPSTSGGDVGANAGADAGANGAAADRAHDQAHDHAHGGGDAGVAPAAKGVAFLWPQEGSTVLSEFDVAFAVQGMTLRPAGEDPLDKHTGHHHLLIDVDAIPAGQVIPKDDAHLHFGKAETTARVKLSPGKHTLRMQLADGAHLSYGPELSATLQVNVVASPKKVGVFFSNMKSGQVLKRTEKSGKPDDPLAVHVEFGVDGMKLRPAGEDVLDKTSGHHHLIIDGGAVPVGQPVPKDETHIHFGKGETAADIQLKKGPHKLTLQFADGAHLSYGPALSTTIEVTVP